MEEAMLNSSTFQARFADITARQRSKFETLIPDWNGKTFKKFCSWVLLTGCSDHSMPALVDDSVQSDCANLLGHWYVEQGRGKYRGVGSAPLMREMFRIADESLALGDRHKFVLLSSHDTAIGAMLATLGIEEIEGIPVRSHLAMELWQIANDVFARFVYNGEPVNVGFLGKTLFRYGNLKAKVAELGYLDHCYIPEKQ
jgi:acid phosphatase